MASSFGLVDSWCTKRSFARSVNTIRRSVNTIRQCLVSNVAGSGARWIDVSAERFPGWISAFAGRHGNPGQHGDPRQAGEPGGLGTPRGEGPAAFTAPDGAVAWCHPPFAESFALPPEAADPDEIAA